jgi:hypothetical protein
MHKYKGCALLDAALKYPAFKLHLGCRTDRLVFCGLQEYQSPKYLLTPSFSLKKVMNLEKKSLTRVRIK